MKQYHQLLGDTVDLEQSDSDEIEVQLAALVESQQQRCVALLVNPWMVLGFKLQLCARLRNTTSKWTYNTLGTVHRGLRCVRIEDCTQTQNMELMG